MIACGCDFGERSCRNGQQLQAQDTSRAQIGGQKAYLDQVRFGRTHGRVQRGDVNESRIRRDEHLEMRSEGGRVVSLVGREQSQRSVRPQAAGAAQGD